MEKYSLSAAGLVWGFVPTFIGVVFLWDHLLVFGAGIIVVSILALVLFASKDAIRDANAMSSFAEDPE